MQQVIKSVCGLCYSGCGILAHLADGKVTKVEGDPDSPVNKGTLCVKGLASPEFLYHPDRLKHPLRRVGNRGEGNWQRASWDEALTIIAEQLTRAKDTYGAESVAFIMGAARGLPDNILQRLANTFGTPNFLSHGYVCMLPRSFAGKVTCGFLTAPDYKYPPACLIVWGANAANTRIGEYMQIDQALKRGTRLIVIDPIKTGLAARADLWVQIRPGSDLALALGMINVIINEGLFDKAFVDNWTVGFDELKAHVQEYTPEKVEEITWVPADTIRQAARRYTMNRPAAIQTGNGIEHNLNSFQTARAILSLEAITGNLDVPGGGVPSTSPRLPWNSLGYLMDLIQRDKLPAGRWERRIDAGLKLIPLNHRVLPQSLVKAIIEEDPYPIHAAFIKSSNVLLTYGNSKETYQALNKLDFWAISDFFMTPTAALADVVLPAATYLEFDNVVAPPYYPSAPVQVQRKVAQIDECWSDLKILNELAKRLGLGKYFWDNEEQLLDDVLRSLGLTFKELEKLGVTSLSENIYRRHEADGFKTSSGKVELYSSQLREWGFDPLPVYYELPETPRSNPELAREYPLILFNWRRAPFHHSSGKQIASFRSSHPEPVVAIHPETADKLGVKEGDWVYIETKRGKIRQKANLSTGIDPRAVGVDFGWWFPEKGVSELYGWAESNVNILTDNKPPYGREVGSPNFRGIFCRVYKE